MPGPDEQFGNFAGQHRGTGRRIALLIKNFGKAAEIVNGRRPRAAC
jgi:hypothetical protein